MTSFSLSAPTFIYFLHLLTLERTVPFFFHVSLWIIQYVSSLSNVTKNSSVKYIYRTLHKVSSCWLILFITYIYQGEKLACERLARQTKDLNNWWMDDVHFGLLIGLLPARHGPRLMGPSASMKSWMREVIGNLSKLSSLAACQVEEASGGCSSDRTGSLTSDKPLHLVDDRPLGEARLSYFLSNVNRDVTDSIIANKIG